MVNFVGEICLVILMLCGIAVVIALVVALIKLLRSLLARLLDKPAPMT